MNDFMKNLFKEIIGSIKRGESFRYLFQFLEKVKWLDAFYYFITPRFLLTIFFSASSSLVLLRIQENISKFMAIPLLFRNRRLNLNQNPLIFNHHMYFAIIESYSLLNLNIGAMARIKGNYEKLLNNLFYSKFEDSPSEFLREGEIDINFDHNSESPRKRSFITVYSQTKNISLLKKLEPLVNIVLVQISSYDLTTKNESKNIKLIRDISKFLLKKKIPFYLLIRDFEKSFNDTTNEEMKLRKVFTKNTQIMFIREGDKSKKTDFEKYFCKKINNQFTNFSKNQKMKMNKKTFLRIFLKEDPLDQFDQGRLKIILKKIKERKILFFCINKTNEFCTEIKKSIKKNTYNKDFFFNDLFLKNVTKQLNYEKSKMSFWNEKKRKNLKRILKI